MESRGSTMDRRSVLGLGLGSLSALILTSMAEASEGSDKAKELIGEVRSGIITCQDAENRCENELVDATEQGRCSRRVKEVCAETKDKTPEKAKSTTESKPEPDHEPSKRLTPPDFAHTNEGTKSKAVASKQTHDSAIQTCDPSEESAIADQVCTKTENGAAWKAPQLIDHVHPNYELMPKDGNPGEVLIRTPGSIKENEGMKWGKPPCACPPEESSGNCENAGPWIIALAALAAAGRAIWNSRVLRKQVDGLEIALKKAVPHGSNPTADAAEAKKAAGEAQASATAAEGANTRAQASATAAEEAGTRVQTSAAAADRAADAINDLPIVIDEARAVTRELRELIDAQTPSAEIEAELVQAEEKPKELASGEGGDEDKGGSGS